MASCSTQPPCHRSSKHSLAATGVDGADSPWPLERRHVLINSRLQHLLLWRGSRCSPRRFIARCRRRHKRLILLRRDSVRRRPRARVCGVKENDNVRKAGGEWSSGRARHCVLAEEARRGPTGRSTTGGKILERSNISPPIIDIDPESVMAHEALKCKKRPDEGI